MTIKFRKKSNPRFLKISRVSVDKDTLERLRPFPREDTNINILISIRIEPGISLDRSDRCLRSSCSK